MKKRRLNKRGKRLITIIIILASVWVYSTTGYTGELAQTSNAWACVCILSWVWLFFGVIASISLLWEE